MVYHFPDIGERWAIRFVEGEAGAPRPVDAAAAQEAEIRYEMDSWVLRAISAGELSGKQAYFRRLLKIQSSFGDMMKLQALNRV